MLDRFLSKCFFSETGMQHLSLTQNPLQLCLCCGLHFLLGSACSRSGGEPYEVESPLLWARGMPVWNQCSRFPLAHWGLCSIKQLCIRIVMMWSRQPALSSLHSLSHAIYVSSCGCFCHRHSYFPFAASDLKDGRFRHFCW